MQQTNRLDFNLLFRVELFIKLKAANVCYIATLFLSLYILVLKMFTDNCFSHPCVFLSLFSLTAAGPFMTLTAKLQEEGGSTGDKSQSSKNPDDCRKSETPTPCQCVCHSKAATSQPDVVDLTASPCKDPVQTPPTAPGHGRWSFYLCGSQSRI